MSELKPCPWCGGTKAYFTQANGNAWYCLSDVACPDCKREVHAKDAIAAWNSLPRAALADTTNNDAPLSDDPAVVARNLERAAQLFPVCYSVEPVGNPGIDDDE